MIITVINGTNRYNNKTINISESLIKILDAFEIENNLVTLENFDQLFRGERISSLDDASDKKLCDIKAMIDSDILIYCVPTYNNSIPSPLKNFIDTISFAQPYENKTIALISSNNKVDYGARQAKQALEGFASYKRLNTRFVPRIPIISYEEPDADELEKFVNYCIQYQKGSI